MRSVVAVVACAALMLVASACSPLKNYNYYREGPGTNLNSPELPEETLSLDQYIADICQQAGLPECPPKFGSEQWGFIVQAGMNDIDRRCDGFLAYVDYLKRSQDHWIKQIGDTLRASSAIVGATTQSDKPLKILSAAFGLATDTYTNMTGRLLTLADQTTIQSVVLGDQKRYREDIIKLGNRIRHKAAAVHALRSYLRICMPITIEAKINSTVTIYEQAGTAALDAKKNDPLINAKTVDGRLTARQPVGRPPRRDIEVVAAYGEFLENPKVSKPFFRSTMKAFCATDDEIASIDGGTIPPETKIRIAIFEATYRPTRTNRARRNGKLDTDELKEVRALGPCRVDGGQNYFERTRYTDVPTGTENVKRLVEALNKVPAGSQLPVDAALAGARDKIKAVRADPNILAKLTLTLPESFANQVTPDLLSALPR